MQKTDRTMTRRELLDRTIKLSLAGTVGVALTGCGNSTTTVCRNPDNLSDAENSLNASLHYTEAAPRSDQVCRGCGFFEAPPDGACGTCTLLKGPVNPLGHCDSWSAAQK